MNAITETSEKKTAWQPPKRRIHWRKWLYKLEGTFDKASNLSEMFHKVTKEPTPWNIAKTAFDLANQLQSMFLINYYEYFQGWSAPYSEDYDYAIVEVLKHLPYEEKATSDPNLSLRLVDIGGVELFYCVNIEHESIEGIHVRNEDLEPARTFIKEAFWDAFGEQFLLMHKRRIFEHDREVGEFLVFDADDEIASHMSKRGKSIAAKVKKFLDGGLSRSILLYGPPGTGKSTMVRAIVRELNLSSLRIRVEDLEDMTNTTIFEAIKIFEPECIIIDDLDRAHRMNHLLEMLERFNKKLKVVFATVNDKDSLGDALLRPGRFDELIEIKELDEETIKRILNEDDNEVFEIVKSWPIAYILEFVKRKTYMSRADALNDLVELRHRVKRVRGYQELGKEINDAELVALRQKVGAIAAKSGGALGVGMMVADEGQIKKATKKQIKDLNDALNGKVKPKKTRSSLAHKTDKRGVAKTGRKKK